MFALMGPVALLAVAAVLTWSIFRSCRARNPLVRWSGVLCLALLGIACSSAGVLATVGVLKLRARTAPVPDITVAATAEQIQQGAVIAASLCGRCHDRGGELVGGYDLGRYLSVPIGAFMTSNLTPGGDLRHWSDGEIFRAIRNSVGKDGNWLVIMSLTGCANLSDADLRAVIAYLRQLPAAGASSASPPDRLNPLGLMMLGAGMLPSRPVSAGVLTAPPRGPSSRYGEYLLSYQDCRGCHGAYLDGREPDGRAASGPSLDVVRAWSPEQFILTMRTGIDPHGHLVSSDMPWRAFGTMDDDALTAIYEYLAHGPAALSVARNEAQP